MEQEPVVFDDRNPDYWSYIRGQLELKVANLSRDLEARNNWGEPKPWIGFKFDWSQQNERAYIKRRGLQATIGYGLGLVVRLDNLAQRIQSNADLRSRLNLADRKGPADLSQWMVLSWFDWAFHHEVAHFFCGHLSAGLPKLVEGKPIKPDDAIFNQAIEFDADMFAAFSFFAFFAHCLKKGIHQDFYGTNDVGEVFWDFGVIFANLFVELEKMRPHDKSRTHPTAAQRLQCLLVEGMATYQAASGQPAAEEYAAFRNGIAVGLTFEGDEGRRFADLIAATTLDTEIWKPRLLRADVHKKRLLSAPNDWLRRT